jgi:hypothetical protein
MEAQAQKPPPVRPISSAELATLNAMAFGRLLVATHFGGIGRST